MYWFAQSVFQDKPVVAKLSGDSLAGKWSATIDTQIGEQHYEYTIETKDSQTSGTAVMKLNGETFNSKLAKVKLEGKSVSFEETLNFQGNDLLITYSGELTADEMQLTRKVGEFATEKFAATRAK